MTHIASGRMTFTKPLFRPIMSSTFAINSGKFHNLAAVGAKTYKSSCMERLKPSGTINSKSSCISPLGLPKSGKIGSLMKFKIPSARRTVSYEELPCERSQNNFITYPFVPSILSMLFCLRHLSDADVLPPLLQHPCLD